MAAKTLATALQKENFKLNFAEIVKNNETLNGKYAIQFFDTAVKSNYVINGLNGKSINVLEMLSIEESDKYKDLKNHWQD
jgi:L-2-hydroxyglutarate oxidase LhgO